MRLPRNRFARVIVLALIAVGALEVLYLLVANVALFVMAQRFGGRAPVGVTYARALTFYPGQLHARGLQVSGPANGGWTVTIADCDVGFDVWQVISNPRQIKRISANVTAVELEARGKTQRLTGTLHVDVTDATFDAQAVSLNAKATVSNVMIESAGETLARDLHGSISFAIQNMDVRKSILEADSATIDLSGTFLSISPLASFASLTATQEPGTVHIAGTVKSGVVQPASELRADTTHATLKDAHGASADYPKGLTVTVSVAPASPNELRLAVQTPQMVFASADAKHPPDMFDSFELVVPAGDTDLRLDHFAMRSLEWRADHVQIHEGASTLSAKAFGKLHFALGDPKRLVADTGTIEATNILTEGTTDDAPFDATIRLDRLVVSREEGIALRGHLHAAGADAKPVIALVVSSPALLRTFALKRQFTADADISRKDSHLSLEELNLDCGGLTILGGYYRNGQESRGAFVAVGLVGIVLKNSAESVVLAPPPSWLVAQLQAASAISR